MTLDGFDMFVRIQDLGDEHALVHVVHAIIADVLEILNIDR